MPGWCRRVRPGDLLADDHNHAVFEARRGTPTHRWCKRCDLCSLGSVREGGCAVGDALRGMPSNRQRVS